MTYKTCSNYCQPGPGPT